MDEGRKFEIVYHDFLECEFLNAKEKIVYIQLKKLANPDGKCSVVMESLSSVLGMTRQTINTILRGLEKKNVLLIETELRNRRVKKIYTLFDSKELWKKKEMSVNENDKEIQKAMDLLKSKGYRIEKNEKNS